MTEPLDKIFDAIRELAQELGHPPSRAEFQAITGISGQEVLKHFSSGGM